MLEPLPTRSILTYMDYRAFLRDYFSAEKTKDPTWSFGIWAKKLQVKSKSSLTMIMKGQRRPGPGIFEKLCNYFEFDQEQRDHFRRLLQIDKRAKDQQTKLLLEAILAAHPDEQSAKDSQRVIEELEIRLNQMSG